MSTVLLLLLGGSGLLVAYATLEQAYHAAETGEDDLLGLAPLFARLRGIDYDARRREYELRMRVAVGSLLDALELGRDLDRPGFVYDQELEPSPEETLEHYRAMLAECEAAEPRASRR